MKRLVVLIATFMIMGVVAPATAAQKSGVNFRIVGTEASFVEGSDALFEVMYEVTAIGGDARFDTSVTPTRHRAAFHFQFIGSAEFSDWTSYVYSNAEYVNDQWIVRAGETNKFFFWVYATGVTGEDLAMRLDSVTWEMDGRERTFRARPKAAWTTPFLP